MHTFLIDAGLVLGGAFATSLAEYFLKYNLVDLLKDKLLGLFSKGAAAAAKAAEDASKK